MKNLRELEIANETIDTIEKSIEFQKGKVRRWHNSDHNISIPEFSFFDLAETESEIAKDEKYLTALKARFNLVLENLKY